MTVYWLTFRIHEATVGNRSYERRYEDLNNAVQGMATKWWADPTSFYAFEANTSISNVMAKCKAAIAPSHDLVLIREIDTKSALITGLIQDQDIFKLMTYLKKA